MVKLVAVGAAAARVAAASRKSGAMASAARHDPLHWQQGRWSTEREEGGRAFLSVGGPPRQWVTRLLRGLGMQIRRCL